MKRRANLFESIATEENFRLAFYKAARGKRDRSEVRSFASKLDCRIKNCVRQLQQQSFPLGRYQQFTIYDPKERVITAPCFEERVLHHAIMNVCEPILDRSMISDTYACREGKGREAAINRGREFSRRFKFVAKLDVSKYFDNISHNQLEVILTHRFKDRRLHNLWMQIIHGYDKTPGRGLPIGSLTSQHLANLYLAGMDRSVKEVQFLKGYVRYMDDMVLWHDSRYELQSVLAHCQTYLDEQLGLKCKQTKIRETACGFDFLGCRIFSSHVELNRRSKRRIYKGIRLFSRASRLAVISELAAQNRLTSIMAFSKAASAKSWRFRQAVLSCNAVNDP